MSTKNHVPRADGEGTIGTTSKRWLKAYLSGGVFFDSTHGIRYNQGGAQWEFCNDGSNWLPFSSDIIKEVTLDNADTIPTNQAKIFRIIGSSPGVIVTLDNLTAQSAKEITIICTDSTNFVRLSGGTNINFMTTAPGRGGIGFDMSKGDIVKLLWIDENSKWQETFSYTSFI